jgi:hypothetical protein
MSVLGWKAPRPRVAMLSAMFASEGRVKPEDYPRCTLSDYRALIGSLPRPSEQQIDHYVKFVAEAHSWYKHLPLLPPGVRFYFFVDPWAGQLRIESRGRLTHRERKDDDEFKFHYTWMTTRVYQERFGHLEYTATGGGMTTMYFGHRGTSEGPDAPVVAMEGRALRMPSEIAQAGSVLLTAVIHPGTAERWVWRLFLPMWNERQWPRETGGECVLNEIRTIRAQVDRPYERIDADLERLLKPERERLHAEMGMAIRRMLDIAFD